MEVRKVANFLNRSWTVTIEVYLKLELAVFVQNRYFLFRSVWVLKQSSFSRWEAIRYILPVHIVIGVSVDEETSEGSVSVDIQHLKGRVRDFQRLNG
jgi:hypothetical protein